MPSSRRRVEVSTARLNKNFAMQSDGLAFAIAESGITGLDLYIFFALLAEAQREDNSTVVFSSRNALIDWLGLPPPTSKAKSSADSHAREALQRALAVWSVRSFAFEVFYKTGDKRRPCHIDRVWTVRRYKNGRVGVTFDPKFWAINSEKAFFLRVKVDEVRKLRHPTRILLKLLLDCYSTPQPWYWDTWALKLLIWDTNRSRARVAMDKAAEAVAMVCGHPVHVSDLPGKKLLIGKRSAGEVADDDD